MTAQRWPKGARLAHEKGIRVLAYDRLIKNADLDLYATFDNVRVRRTAGEDSSPITLQLAVEKSASSASMAAPRTTTPSSSSKARTMC
jgi:ABC-type xylose transport system substrate-binding protein